MDPLQLVGRAQASLIEEEWKQLDEAVVKAVQPVLVGRRVLPVKALAGVGVMTVTWDELTEMSEALISMYGETPAEDIIVYARKSLIESTTLKSNHINTILEKSKWGIEAEYSQNHFHKSFHDKILCETICRLSRDEVLGLLREPVHVSLVPDVEKGEVLLDSRGRG